MNRDGNEVGTLGERAEYSEVTLSDDGRTAAAIVSDIDGNSEFWLIDVERDTRRHFTFTSDDASLRRSEVNWSGDGTFLVYGCESEEGLSIARKATDGSSPEVILYHEPGASVWPYDVSADNQWVVFGKQNEEGNEDLWILPASGEGDARPLFETPFDEWPGVVSPDGRWLVLDSDETGRREIYVIPFPEGRGRWQVSRDGGRFPRWSTDGDELYYVGLDGMLMQASVQPEGAVFKATEPRLLMETKMFAGNYASYDVMPDGERFLLLEQASQFAPISLFTNWVGALEGR
jgi:Tol biopolymer transport system component